MILRSVWIKNNTAAILTFLGTDIAPNSKEDFSYESDLDLQTDDTLIAALQNGTASIGDGITYTTPQNSMNALIYTPLSPALAASGAVIPPVSPQTLFRYNGKGSQSIRSKVTNVIFPSVVREDNGFKYNLSSGVITINDDGWFKITTMVSMTRLRDNQYTEVSIYINNKPANGAIGYISGKENDNLSSISVNCLNNMLSGDTIEIKAQAVNSRHRGRRSPTQRTVAGSCNLLIERA